MKQKIFTLLLLAAVVLSIQTAQAKIRRVGYFGTPISGTDYATVQGAHDAANKGDTLLIFPGSYGTTIFTKRLVLLGYGYFVSGAGANTGLQVITGALSLDIRLSNGSDSTILEGLDGLLLTAQPSIDLKNVLVKRCNVTVRYTNAKLTNWQIKQSVIHSIYGAYGSGAIFTNLLVENCIISSLYFDLVSTTSTGLFNNNVFGTGTLNFNNGAYSLYNNIFLSTSAPANIANCYFDYNIASNNIIPTGTGTHNKSDVTLSTVFVGYPTQGTYSNDGRFKLASGSPAIKAGEGGIDCGIFGGKNPYHLSGIPPIPSFYKLTAPSNIATTNPYTITFSVRSNN